MGSLFNWLTTALGGEGNTNRRKTVQWLMLLGLVGIGFMLASSSLHIKQLDPIPGLGAGSAGGDGGGGGIPSVAAASQVSQGLLDSRFGEYERKYAGALKDILEKIVGVGEVEVLVTIDSTEEIVVERHHKDNQQTTQEKDQNGATRHITDVGRDGQVVLYETNGRGGATVPLVVKTIKPQIRGVVVVARGAENAAVKKMLMDAVERGLAVPAHRISVVPRKQ